MKDNIYIVTWQGEGNYGTSMQSYSLYKFLRNRGYKSFYLREFILNDYPGKKTKNMLHSLGLWDFINSFRHKPITIKEKKLKKFNKTHYHIKEVFTHKEYVRLLASAKAFITGSDQIWNAYHYFNPYFFLNFAQEEKRIAYASSMGPNSFPEQYREEIKSLLSKFSHIGLRESSAVDTVRSLIGKDHHVCSVLDPTFLLTKNEWMKLSEEAKIEFQLPKKYILCYFIGHRTIYADYVESIKKKTGIETVILLSAESEPTVPIKQSLFYKDAGPIEFVKLLLNATLVCSDSFHASAMSLNLEKQFVVFERFQNNDIKSQNSRIYDLTQMFCAEEALYRDHNHAVNILDYSTITPIINKKREESITVLLNSIES